MINTKSLVLKADQGPIDQYNLQLIAGVNSDQK